MEANQGFDIDGEQLVLPMDLSEAVEVVEVETTEPVDVFTLIDPLGNKKPSKEWKAWHAASKARQRRREREVEQDAIAGLLDELSNSFSPRRRLGGQTSGTS